MFKYPEEGSGDVWSEKIAAEIGKKVGFNIQEVELAVYNGAYGSLSYWFLEVGESLVEGADLFKEEGIKINEWSKEGHDFQMIEGILSTHNSLLIRDFIEILVFDVLIGNTDRHSQNWGIITSLTGEERLAPAYDNSSSLGRELNSNPTLIELKLKDLTSFKAFCHSKKGACFIGFEGEFKIPHLDYIRLLNKAHPEIVQMCLKKLKNLTPQILNEIIGNVPNTIMSDVCKRFVRKIIDYRLNYLLGIAEGSN